MADEIATEDPTTQTNLVYWITDYMTTTIATPTTTQAYSGNLGVGIIVLIVFAVLLCCLVIICLPLLCLCGCCGLACSAFAMDDVTDITDEDVFEIFYNVTTVVHRTTTHAPETHMGLWGLLFIFLVIILIVVLCCTCMALLVLFGCIKSFMCFRCRNREEFVGSDP
ncbi:uncharacterized protein LOC108043446 [Drosophila rhopaloa]|uniref:Uncharacterized protein n=1 Tax=Drosophila rhopaloa TaxID=1041015 RepID=A0ABM5HBJ3_DRORH|nr:uncharacterized protein LOC108043446 [Drosophila rhopaloa]